MKRIEKWNHFFALVLFVSLSIVGLSGCGIGKQAESKVLTYKDFINQFSKEGCEIDDKIQPLDNISASLFSVKPQIISVYFEDKKEEVLVHNFLNKKSADTEAMRVSGNGNKVGDLYIEGERHFYKSGNMIIAYFGSNRTILNSLDKIVGKAFASSNY